MQHVRLVIVVKPCKTSVDPQIYKGYVDDPRNTDNAWMETVAFNFHDENGTVFTMKFHSGHLSQLL